MPAHKNLDPAFGALLEVRRIIVDLENLPADHEPSTSDLWDALSRIKDCLAGISSL